MQSVGLDFGLSMTLSMHTGSAAVVGICKRAGIGRTSRRLPPVQRGDVKASDALTR